MHHKNQVSILPKLPNKLVGKVFQLSLWTLKNKKGKSLSNNLIYATAQNAWKLHEMHIKRQYKQIEDVGIPWGIHRCSCVSVYGFHK